MRLPRPVTALLVASVGVLAGCGNAVVPVVGRSVPVSTSATQTSTPTPSSTVLAPASASPSAASSPSPSWTSPSPAPLPTPSPTTLSVADKQVRNWPAGIVLPPRTTLTSASTDSRGGVVTLSGPTRTAVLDSLASQFVDAGIAVEVDSPTAFHFRGVGWSGQVAADGAVVIVRWVVGDAAATRYPGDMGLGSGVPPMMRYPSGAAVANHRAYSGGASYDLTGRSPAEILSFYRAELSPLFTVTDDLTEDGVTTLRFVDGEYDSVITATNTSFRLTHTRRS